MWHLVTGGHRDWTWWNSAIIVTHCTHWPQGANPVWHLSSRHKFHRFFQKWFFLLKVFLLNLADCIVLRNKYYYYIRVCPSEKTQFFLTPSKIDFLSWNITTGLDYGDLGHFWPPRAIWGVWGAYVGFRGAWKRQIYQFPHEIIFGPEMSFFGPN